jgi:hypothetical protein
MSDKLTSIDEFLSHHKGFVKSGDILLKASRSSSSWDPEERSMSFVMSAEVEDRDRDIVYQAGLDITEFMKNPVGFFNHRSYDRPHGTWTNLRKILNGRPRRTEGKFTCAPEGVNPVADALAADMGADLIRACSIGFRPKAVKKREIPEDKKDLPYYWPGYDILEAELLECSPCTIPSNPAALAKSAAAGNTLAKELIEEVLDNWAKSPAGLLIPRAEFDAAHKEAGGNKTSAVVSADITNLPDVQAFVKAVGKLGDAVKDVHAAAEKLGANDDQTSSDQTAPEDNAGAGKAVLDGNKAVTGTVTGEIKIVNNSGTDVQQTVERNDDGSVTITLNKHGAVEPKPKARPSEPPADWTVNGKDPVQVLADMQKPQARSFIRKLLDLAFGAENEPKLEQELRAKSEANEPEEQARKDALDARRKELQERFQSISTRVEEKGLV